MYKAVFQVIKGAEDGEVCLACHRGPDKPRDQEHPHRECEANRNLRPHLAAKHESLKTEGGSERYRAGD